jgi:hypothetical protein
MLTNEFRKLIAPLARTLMIIWGAFLAAPLVYLFIAWTLNRKAAAPDSFTAEGTGPPLVGILGAVIMVLLVAVSIFLERRAFSPATLRRKAAVAPSFTTLVPRPTAANEASGRLFGSLSDSEQKRACLFPHFQTTHIVIWALRETVAVMGLVLAIVTGDFSLAVTFCLASFVLLAVKPPRPTAFFGNLDL